MSLWSTIGGIALGGVGVLTGQPELIGAGVGLIGAGVQSDQASKAANAQINAQQQGINLLSNIYGGTRQNLAPFQALGTSSLGNLYALTGQQAPATLTNPNANAMWTTNGGQSTAAATTLMQAPDGSTMQVPMTQVQQALAKGARVVQPGGQQLPIGGNPSVGGIR